MRRTTVRGWRWRHNTLRRPSDRAEAWIVLATWILALVGGLGTAQLTGDRVADGLAERRDRAQPVSAVLVEDAPTVPVTTGEGFSNSTVWAKVRWTDADGAPHTGRAQVDPGSEAGTSVTVWTGTTGTLVAPPPTAMEAEFQSVLAGTLAGLTAAGTLVGCGRLARFGLDRRRLHAWETEWARVGPQWRKRMYG
ncbi:hypothetical protein [Streptomyces sp. TRM68416]|uniref:Rv1733c family protein n=1 Tax=Streptomyces sp. TRM68416 TaxID=2758412 RepID=UPI001661EC02|nr:hypothetical protein [Streptomyces sp. TRM68416]MBD0842060.1 hypothetical protein [Streptomyces sp. TRM68416]